MLTTRETLRYKILSHLATVGVDSLSGITRELGVTRAEIRDKLWVMLRRRHIRMELVNERMPWGGLVKVNKIWITPEGREWLKANSG